METVKKIRKPTIKDVANVCGVSAATVSYAMNGKSVLRSHTRERILKAMREMNYYPNALARGLQTRTMRAVGVLLGTVAPTEFVANPYTSRILQGIVQEAHKQKFHVTLFTDEWKGAEISGASVRDGRTDGILAVAPILGTDLMDELPLLQPNLVAISAPSRPNVNVIDVDDYQGALMATEHLIGLGHRRIAYLTGNSDLASFEPRLKGFNDAMESAGLDVMPGYIVESGFDGSQAAAQTTALLQLADRPTAIFAGNDTIALGVIEAARALALSVPDDLSVVGYDDMASASLVTPKLTTIHQPLIEIGSLATRTLIERILESETERSHRPATTIRLMPTLVERETTARLID